MMKDPKQIARVALQSARVNVEVYEACGLIDTPSAHGLRYKIAVQASDVNGDECRFPSCACTWPDCSRQAEAGAAGDQPSGPTVST
ncbi:hypothetical protein JJL56_02545 [Azospirillum sp. YIM DDC1]|uniref:Uncharacterized protein n=1 Tax=Azospirillum aestuarii TaxID=2802052 RepID=A0ABS1HTL0_9PROT|nr:hypothetical protein [Azospirillum aestuarii]MBK4717737.1 hypothetical protein [Azospirillum aestuarii]